LGAEAELAWGVCAAHPDVEPLARAAVRVADSGAALATALRVLAGERRSEAQADARAIVQRVGVQGVLPVGLCFLPAFVLVGIVPAAMGLLGGVLRSAT
jgi:pilus assembly protein TadC